MTAGPQSRPTGRPDAALWTVVDASTRRLAARTVEAFSTRRSAEIIAGRYQRNSVEQRAGHLFELWHGHTFNQDAIRKGASVRADVTAVRGEPTAAADLRVVDHGTVLGEVQAKLYGRPTATVRALAQPKYDGMQRLVASDKRDPVDALLDKALQRDPDGIHQAAYADTRTNLTDTVSHGDVHSTPVVSEEMHRIAEAPRRWADREAAGAAGRQIRGAALTGAAVGGAVAGLTAAVRETARLRAGKTSAAAAACTAAGAAARGAARSGALTGVGATVEVAMTAAKVPGSTSGLPGAVASAVLGVADAGVALARGEIDAGGFAELSGAVTFQAGMAWAGGAVGQTVLPVPVVGALVGGFVGQICATLIAQGLQLAIAAVRADGPGDNGVALLESEVEAALTAAAVLGEAERDLGREYDAYVGTVVVPLLDDVVRTTATGRTEDGLAELAQVAADFDEKPLFLGLQEFDAWMADPLTTLSLSTNRT